MGAVALVKQTHDLVASNMAVQARLKGSQGVINHV
jgi:hypothetical protein